MLIPSYLKPGDTIGIISTARKISKSELKPAIKLFEDWGLNVVTGKNIFNSCNQFAGNDEERASDLQDMLDNDDIKAIICARGGYGTVRIVDLINFNNFINKPKWLIGYSDITVLHSHIQNLGVETLHAIMPVNINKASAYAIETLRKALFGEDLKYEVKANIFNRTGEANGTITGGNLSVLYSIAGSRSEVDFKDKILFLEDLDEYLYHIERMLINLKRRGIFRQISGLIIGGMTEMHDNTIPFGNDAYEIINDIVSDYNYPVCYNFPAGHIDDNRALILGRDISLKVGISNSVINF
ncbi:MAG: LD-carboxypeptidase [Bacteroidota bacterium]|nr:LD-carboxypeptidase [Bacteroidota bacterium]